MCVCVSMRVHVCVCVSMRVHVCVCMRVSMRVCVFVCMRAFTCCHLSSVLLKSSPCIGTQIQTHSSR